MIALYGVTKMKKIAFILLFALLAQFLFATETIWLWDHNDNDVAYYRYQTSFDEKWRTVPSDHYSVKVNSGDVNEYDFVLQQSYDGVNWSESTVKNHVIKQETTAPVIGKTKSNKGLVLSMQIVPFESYIATKPHDSRVEKKSKYSLGLDGEVSFFFEKFGIGAQAGINMGWEEFSLVPFSAAKERIYGGAYLILSYRILDGNRFVILTQLGFGTNYELINNVTYLSPSILFALEGGIRIDENITISMKPSFTTSFASWNGEGEYTSFVIKTVSIGSSYRF